MKKVNKDKITKFIKGGTYEAVGEAIKMIPGVNIVWGFITGGKAAIDEVAYVRTEELFTFFENNSSTILNEQLLKDEQFIIGLGLTYENYLRQRLEIKRKLMRKVFLEFARSNSKKDFELERMYQVLNLISPGAISFLGLLSKEALGKQSEAFERSPYNDSAEYWAGMPRLQKEHPISKFLQMYKDMNISLGENKLSKDVLNILKYEDEFVSELVGLGVFRNIPNEEIKVKERAGKTELKFQMEYSFTEFGLEFIRFIDV